MDTPEKKPASSIANRPRVTPSATTNLKREENMKEFVLNWAKLTQVLLTFCPLCHTPLG